MKVSKKTTLQECIDYLRSCSNNWAEKIIPIDLLENVILPSVGMNDDKLHEIPEELHQYCGYGLRSWQVPNQFAPFINWIREQKNIRSYLEIGVKYGGTFIILNELCKFQSSVALDLIDISSTLQEYQKENTFEYLKLNSNSPEFEEFILKQKIDLVLIDGGHAYETVLKDFETCLQYAKYIALHDIVNNACPGVVRLWSEIKRKHINTIEFTQQYPGQQKSWFGIGIVILDSK